MLTTNSLNQQKWLNATFWLVSLLTFVVIAIRSYVVPFHHDEVATFYFYIQTGNYLPFMAHIDANNHVLNSTLSFICFKLFGDSLFSLRLPNTLSYLVLVFGAWRLFKELKTPSAKVVLIGGLLLSFHFHTFFSTCRGYGLSMALLVFSISYFSSYIKTFSVKEFILFLLSFQLAISSNLILIMVILPLLAVIGLAQLFYKQLNCKTILLHLINVGLLYYWIKYSFFLQENNALYYGDGLSYYKTTYLSLTRLLSGYNNQWIAISGSAVLIISMLLAAYWALKAKFNLKKLTQVNSVVFIAVLASLIIGFYALKKLMGVNYPEDRTGLFFYVFFVIALTFVLDEFSFNLNHSIAVGVLILFVAHFSMALNFRKHSLVNYETIPPSFYDYLANEQKQHKEKITISGHRVRELFYAFDNYHHNGELNLMDDSDFLHMNADYALALKNEKGYYQNYYDEVMTEPDWNFVLLKRRFPITRKLTLDLKLDIKAQGTNEFYDIYKKYQDTIIANHKPIMVEFDFKVVNKDVPNRSWLVMQIDTEEEGHYYYKRIPLNWLHYKWEEGKVHTYGLCSGPLDKKLKNMSFYIYNHKNQNIDIEVIGLRLYELHGKGVEVVSKVIN